MDGPEQTDVCVGEEEGVDSVDTIFTSNPYTLALVDFLDLIPLQQGVVGKVELFSSWTKVSHNHVKEEVPSNRN